jgi:putative transposase
MYNSSTGRTGSLWEGRFKSCLTQEKRYVRACYRYIELNPVRAGMVPNPRNYSRSSYGCDGADDPNPLITPHLQYLGLSANSEERLDSYRELIEEKFD